MDNKYNKVVFDAYSDTFTRVTAYKDDSVVDTVYLDNVSVKHFLRHSLLAGTREAQ